MEAKQILTAVDEAVVGRRVNGDLLLRNCLETAVYPANLATWLRENGAQLSHKPFLHERTSRLGKC